MQDACTASNYLSLVPRPRKAARGPLRLQAWIDHRGLTQIDLATALDISTSQASRLIRGVSNINLEQILAAARLLRCEPMDLFVDPQARSADAMLVNLDADKRERALRHLEFYIQNDLTRDA